MNIQRDLIEHWQRRALEKGIGILPSAEYRRHAKVFTLLIAACSGDAVKAQRSIDAFFDDEYAPIEASGWDIGMFQKRYAGYIVKVKKADDRAAANARRWVADGRANAAEQAERTMQMPKPPPEAVPDVGPKLAALKARLFGKAGGL